MPAVAADQVIVSNEVAAALLIGMVNIGNYVPAINK